MYRENLKKLRFELKLSAQKLADDLGIHKMTVSNYENGKREPTYEVMEKLHTLYNVNLNWFVSGQGEMFIKEQPADFKSTVKQAIQELIREGQLSKDDFI